MSVIEGQKGVTSCSLQNSTPAKPSFEFQILLLIYVLKMNFSYFYIVSFVSYIIL